jgi:hypothetical protein
MDPQTTPPVPLPPPPPAKRRRLVIVGVVALLVLSAGAIAIAAAGGDGGGASGGSTAAPTSPSPSLQPPAAVASLRASAGAFQVQLSWKAGTDGAAAIRYDIQRDSKNVGFTDGTSWVDSHVVPGQKYAYQVIAVSADGLRSPAKVTTTTKDAPPGTAALMGVFNVKLHPTSHSGLSSFNDKDSNAGWRFVPTCKQPPCDTGLKDLHWKDFRMTLTRREGTYTGSTSVSGIVSCSGRGVSTTMSVTIKTTKADAVRDDWRVTAFTGTMTQYSSSQLGCVSSSVHWNVTGTLVAS